MIAHTGKTNKPVGGRFAPSPTGPLHFGSLVAAVGSCLSARAQGGGWQLRMEDLDPPREIPGAADDILRTLEVYGFEWDGPVLWQSSRGAAYQEALDALTQHGMLYACGCTRREIADSSVHGIEGPVYPGTCRTRSPPGRPLHTLRVHTDTTVIEFDDRVQGRQRAQLETDIGDFVVRRADGLTAYQLACVVDDAAQGITEVVRGADLLASTARQIHLQRLLGVPTPDYLHLPVVLNAAGEKLSKQTLARPLASAQPQAQLVEALAFLGQDPAPDWRTGSVAELWAAALARWSESSIPRRSGIMVPHAASSAV